MVEPVSVVLAALGGHFLSQMWDGILGNEAHRLTHVAVRKTLQLIDGDADEKVNHDIARTVRLAQVAALEAVLDGYDRAHGDAWDSGTLDRPGSFLDAAAKFCRDQRRLAKHDPASTPSRATESLTTAIDGLLDQSPPATLAGATIRDITASIAAVAEDEVLRELGEGLDGAVVPADFAVMLRSGRGASAPRFLDIFASHIREAVKSNPRFRDIMLVSGLAEIKARGFEITGILLQIETQLGVDRDELRNSLERLRDTATAIKADTEDLKQGQRRLEQMVMDLAAGGAPAIHAIGEIRDLFRPSRPDIDQMPVEQLPRLVRGVIEELAKPGPTPEDFAGAVGRALAEAQTRIGDLAFADAASGLDDALVKAESSFRNDARGLAALLTERGRVSRLQLRYREAAGFFDRAAEAVSFDPAAASAHALTAADALFDQGNEFGDNAALIDAIARYRSTLERTQRERAPDHWATIQNNLGNALRTLGARESGTVRLEEAVVAYRRAQEERTRERVPLDWATTQNNLGNALATLGERESGTARLGEAVAAYRLALEEWTRDRVPLDWATTQNNLGNAVAALGERESGTARLEQAVAAYRLALQERTRDRVPLNWAFSRHTLAKALAVLAERTGDRARMTEALTALRDAARVYRESGNSYLLPIAEREIKKIEARLARMKR